MAPASCGAAATCTGVPGSAWSLREEGSGDEVGWVWMGYL